MKVKLDFEVEEETILLASKALNRVANEDGNGLTEKQKTILTNFALNLLLAKNEQSDAHQEIGTIAKTFFDFVGAEIVNITPDPIDG